jgi:hypothetical protein
VTLEIQFGTASNTMFSTTFLVDLNETVDILKADGDVVSQFSIYITWL